MNYSQLVTAISDYTENTFNLADMNTFITQAEQRIYNTVQFPSLRKNMIGAMTTGLKYLSAPDDYLATYSMAVIENAGNCALANLCFGCNVFDCGVFLSHFRQVSQKKPLSSIVGPGGHLGMRWLVDKATLNLPS